MVTSTFSSGSSGAALPTVRDGSWSAGQNPVSGPGDNWSRVRDQRLKGQTGRSVLMDRWAGRPGRGPTPAGLRGGRGDGGFAVGVVGIRVVGIRVVAVVGVIGVVAVQVVVEVEVVVLIVIVFVVILEVLIVEVLIVEVDLVVFIGFVFVGVVEVAILQVFFRGLTCDLLLDLSIGFGVFPVMLDDCLIDVLGALGVVGFVVVATVGRGHCLEHRMFAGSVDRHFGHCLLVGLALLGTPAPLAARLGFATGRRRGVDGIGVQRYSAAAAVRTRRRERLD